MKLYTEEEVKQMLDFFQVRDEDIVQFIDKMKPIELASDEEILKRYIFYIDTEIQLGFLKQEQGERLKWYYKTYFINKIQGGNNEQQ